MVAIAVSADLRFELAVEGRPLVTGHLHGHDNRLQLDVDDPAAFAGSQDSPAIRLFAETLALRGVVVRVCDHGTHLVSLGAVSAPWWQRRVTGSRRIRVASLRGAWAAARARARATDPVLPDPSLLPPGTLWPLTPTFNRRPRRRPTTTHDPGRGGGARLVLVREQVRAGERQPVYWLEDQVTIGSDPGCGIVLPGLAPRHATITHDDQDEYVVAAVAGVVRVHGARVRTSILRTGTRLQVGDHQLAFTREEHADHGRPHGGRLGGEFGVQLPQAPRRADHQPPGH